MNRHVLTAALIVAFVAVAVVGWLRPAAAGSPATELAQNNVMQCMEQCIRAEGSSEKATCKSRCANISSQPRPQRDCMQVYKSCQRNCGSNQPCRQGCKSQLMQCS